MNSSKVSNGLRGREKMKGKLLGIVVAACAACLVGGVLAGCSSTASGSAGSGGSSGSAEVSESSKSVEPITPEQLREKGIYVQKSEKKKRDEYGNVVEDISGANDNVSTIEYDDPKSGYYTFMHTDMGSETLAVSMESIPEWQFDDQGRAVSMDSYAPNGRLYTSNSWSYNDKGTLSEMTISGTTRKYDEYGYLTSIGNGTKTTDFEWIRDEAGMVTGFKQKKSDSSSEVEYSVDTNEAGYITAVYRVTDGQRESTPEKTYEYEKIDNPSKRISLEGFTKEVLL